ncbi:hypothetical protein A6I87_02710 [Prescottella equi]|nr:hypothetical protein A6I87_02710 [Prescottella equi]
MASRGQVILDRPQVDLSRQTIRKVCGQCNNGWMSRLELDAKAVLTRMQEAKPIILERGELETLRRWALKTAVMRECVDPHPAIFTRQQALSIAAGRLPSGVEVLLTSIDREVPPFITMARTYGAIEDAPSEGEGELDRDPRESPTVAFATIVVGWTVLQVRHTCLRTPPIDFRTVGGPSVVFLNSASRTLWPTVPALSMTGYWNFSRWLHTFGQPQTDTPAATP